MDKDGIISLLKNGGIGVLATDTLYGVVGKALSEEIVERIYKVRRRNPDKPLIILISSIQDLEFFGISPESEEVNLAQKYWPGKVSIILPCADARFRYLHRGTNSLAFRLPEKPDLLQILKETGPLVAPSANYEGYPPAYTIEEAYKYFGDEVDFYEDSGEVKSEPSTIIKIEGNQTFLVRKGVVEFTN